jgi:integrase
MIRSRNRGWQADVNIDGRRHRKQFTTEEAAKAWEEGLLAQAAKAALVALQPAKGPVLGTIEQDVFNRQWRGSKNAHDASLVLKAVVRGLGADTELTTINASKIDGYVRTMQERGCSSGTINRHLSCIRQLMKFALTRNYVTAVPVIEQLKEAKGRTRYYSLEEQAAILKACQELGLLDFAELIRFLVWTGCRLSEAYNLQWADVSMSQVTFAVTKGDRARSIPLSRDLETMLQRRAASKRSNMVFPGWNHPRVARAWNDVKKRTGITDKDAVMHGWRHTCASRMIQSGVCLTQVQKWLGHSTLEMTLRYSHLSPNALAQARDTMERSVFKGSDAVTGDMSPCRTLSQEAS